MSRGEPGSFGARSMGLKPFLSCADEKGETGGAVRALWGFRYRLNFGG